MFPSRDLRTYPYFEKEEYTVNNQKSISTQVYRLTDYMSNEPEEVHSLSHLTAAEMISMTNETRYSEFSQLL